MSYEPFILFLEVTEWDWKSHSVKLKLPVRAVLAQAAVKESIVSIVSIVSMLSTKWGFESPLFPLFPLFPSYLQPNCSRNKQRKGDICSIEMNVFAFILLNSNRSELNIMGLMSVNPVIHNYES